MTFTRPKLTGPSVLFCLDKTWSRDPGEEEGIREAEPMSTTRITKYLHAIAWECIIQRSLNICSMNWSPLYEWTTANGDGTKMNQFLPAPCDYWLCWLASSFGMRWWLQKCVTRTASAYFYCHHKKRVSKLVIKHELIISCFFLLRQLVRHWGFLRGLETISVLVASTDQILKNVLSTIQDPRNYWYRGRYTASLMCVAGGLGGVFIKICHSNNQT